MQSFIKLFVKDPDVSLNLSLTYIECLCYCCHPGMRITQVKAAGLRGATPEGGWTREIKPDECIHTLVAVYTDEGVTGWGSSFTNGALVQAALRLLEPLLFGENPLEPERLTEKLHANTFWMGRGGSITHAISGIDIALWDILGKTTRQPVGRLLGGRYRDRVRPYASLLMVEPGKMRDRLLPIREQGFRAFKIGWGPFGRGTSATDEKIVREAREAVGSESLLMVDAGGSDAFWPQDYKWALRTAEMLANYGVHWFEEPLPPDNMRDFVLLRANSPVKISGGEVLTRRQSFEPWILAGAFDIVQPDVTKVGGVSDERRIAWMAEDNGIQFIPHGWNTALGLAADLHLASACRNTNLVEYLTGSPFIDEIVEKPWKLDGEGMLPIPDEPGLGVSLNMEAVEKYTGVRFDES
jgi:D-galactarolactone cycloisomerase